MIPLPDPDVPNTHGGPGSHTADQLRAYGDARAAEERERCALIAHNKALHCEDHDNPYGQGAALDIEDAIRAPDQSCFTAP